MLQFLFIVISVTAFTNNCILCYLIRLERMLGSIFKINLNMLLNDTSSGNFIMNITVGIAMKKQREAYQQFYNFGSFHYYSQFYCLLPASIPLIPVKSGSSPFAKGECPVMQGKGDLKISIYYYFVNTKLFSIKKTR